MRILAVDQGTTNTKAVLFDERLVPLASASAPLSTSYPRDGWAEQSAAGIWSSVVAVIDRIVAGTDGGIDAIAIANQRETLVTWDAQTGAPVGPAILWQCRRTAETCADLIADGHGPAVEAATGLGINPLFPASKLGWVIRNSEAARALAETGRLRAGTVDAWLIWKLTGGAVFATDHSNASRTQLFDTAALAFDPSLCELFGVPLAALPQPRASDAGFGTTAASATSLPEGVPIAAVMGDSHAALYGHGVRTPGIVKATYGTGSSLMALTGSRINSTNGLSGTIAWTAAGKTAYALEGNITVSAHAAAFAASLLGVADAAALAELAQSVESAGGVAFVPALAGLGAPHWDDAARGTLSGLSLGSTRAEVARAVFDGIAHQIADVFEAMELDAGSRLDGLRADGGASANAWLMQLQADLLGREVLRCDSAEIGARGVAAMALSANGGAVPETAAIDTFVPGMPAEARMRARQRWAAAVQQARYA